MKNSIKSIIIIFLITFTSLTNAQTFINYTTSDGLPDNFINGGVAVDTNNVKWFGTTMGIASYDGSTWAVYDTSDGLIDNYTICIAVDFDNNIWVGTNFGVSKFDGVTFTDYKMSDGLIDNTVKYIAADLSGNVWFATGAGVSKFDGSTFTNYTSLDGLAADDVNYIAVDELDNKWFGTMMGGYSKYNNSTFTTYSTANIDSLADNSVFAIAIDNSDNQWIGTWYGISFINNSGAWVANYDTSNLLYNNYVRDMDINSDGDLWVGFFADYNGEGGISKFDGTDWTSYSVTDGLADKQVIRLAVDQDNIVWIATGNGVSRLTDNTGIRQFQNTGSCKIYPNPATDIVTIESNQFPAQLILTDVYGNSIRNISVSEPSYKMETGMLSAGTYILQIRSNDSVFTAKLIVQ